jgi:aminopeptidase N
MMRKYTCTFLLLCCFHFIVYAQQYSCSYGKKSTSNIDFASPADIDKMNEYDVHFYKLDIDVERNSVYVKGNVEIHAKAVKNLSVFVFQLHDTLTIDSIFINGNKFSFTRLKGIVNVNITPSIAINSNIVAKIYYRGFCPQTKNSANGNGFSNSDSLEVTWSLSESFVAYEWWPCKQVLYDKADSAEIWITTDSANKAGSNGLLINTTILPNAKKRYEWKTHYPIDYYLISVAVAKYQEYNIYAYPDGLSQPILIQNYIYDTSVIPVLNLTPSFINVFSKLYGIYPFWKEKYGHCMAPINGGMEHQTMTTIGPKSAITFEVVSHELAHQWFGDYVTCGSWADIWLNEGFASYSQYVANEQLNTGYAPFLMASTMLGAKNAWGAVYVHDTLNTSTIFNGPNTYMKGSVIIHMLRYEINNDSIFFLGLRNYLQAHQFSTALGTDFQTIMEQTSGKKLDYFFNQWYRGLGYPVFGIKWNQINDKLYVVLNQSTTNTATWLFKTSLDISLVDSSGDSSIARVWIDSLQKVFTFDVSGKIISSIRIDTKGWVLHDVSAIIKDPLVNALNEVTNDSKNVIIYPNPAHTILTISNAIGTYIEVFDISGKKLITKNIIDANSTIDLNEIQSGFYFIRIHKNGAISNLKFVKE